MDKTADDHSSFFFGATFAYASYFVLALPLLAAYRLQLNPDAVSYFGIAGEYWHGMFRAAVNGAFSPLYSWLLIPLLSAGMPGPLAARMLAIPVGAGVVFVADSLMRRLNLSSDLRRAIRLALVIPVLSLGFIVVTPDLLATLLTLLYLLLICSPVYLNRPRAWVGAGLLGTAMYLTKAYAMWFFLGHFVVVHVIWLFQSQRRGRVVAAMVVGLATFVVTATPWVSALSWKYGHFALNTTGTYNHAIEGPDAPAFPPGEMGLLPPPTAMAVSVWEDVSQIHLPDWDEFASRANFNHFLLVIARNMGDLVEEISCYSLFLLAIGIVAGIVMVRTRMSGVSMILTWAALIYPLGYLLRHIEQRFISAPAIVLILLGGYLIDRAAEAYALPRIHRTIAIWALCLSVLPNSIWNLIRYSGHEGRRLQLVGEYISSYIPAHANVASDSDWFTSMYASYYAQLRYYGMARPNGSVDEFARSVRENKVRYLLVWNKNHFVFLHEWRRLTGESSVPAVFEAPGPP